MMGKSRVGRAWTNVTVDFFQTLLTVRILGFDPFVSLVKLHGDQGQALPQLAHLRWREGRRRKLRQLTVRRQRKTLLQRGVLVWREAQGAADMTLRLRHALGESHALVQPM